MDIEKAPCYSVWDKPALRSLKAIRTLLRFCRCLHFLLFVSELVSSLLQHILFQILLPQVEARVTVTGEIAPGVSLETSPQWIWEGRIVKEQFRRFLYFRVSFGSPPYICSLPPEVILHCPCPVGSARSPVFQLIRVLFTLMPVVCQLKVANDCVGEKGANLKINCCSALREVDKTAGNAGIPHWNQNKDRSPHRLRSWSRTKEAKRINHARLYPPKISLFAGPPFSSPLGELLTINLPRSR